MEHSRHSFKKRRKRRILRMILLLFMLLLIGVGSYCGYLFFTIKSVADESYQEPKREKSELRIEDVKLGKDPVTILLMGIEDYQGGRGRSDVLLLVAINPETKEKAIVSIPRDTLTYIDKVERKDKINHAYAFGGVDSAIRAVENLLNVPIDYYVTTNFKGFESAVNSLNGIDLDVPFSFKTYDTEGRWVVFEEGPMHMDGREALAYVRMRYEDPLGDFGRNKRQQQAIKAMLKKAISFQSISKIDNLVKDVGKEIKTDISFNEILGLRNFYNELIDKDIESLSIKGEDTYINDVYYFVPNDDSIQETTEKLYGILEIAPPNNVTNSDDNSVND